MNTFNKGDRVRVKESALDGYPKSLEARLRGREGLVTGHAGRNPNRVFVTFPKNGRKLEFHFPGYIHASDLEPTDGDRDG
jgi:hypothetical protein